MKGLMIMSTALRKREELNIRQKHFVDYYIQTGNATESAKKAGYLLKSAYQVGCELLKNPKIQTALNTRLKELESELIAKDKEILEYLTKVMRGQTEDEVVVNVGVGKGFTEAQKVTAKVGAKERLKAAEMLAKVKGLFVSKSELEINGSVPVVIVDDI